MGSKCTLYHGERPEKKRSEVPFPMELVGNGLCPLPQSARVGSEMETLSVDDPVGFLELYLFDSSRNLVPYGLNVDLTPDMARYLTSTIRVPFHQPDL